MKKPWITFIYLIIVAVVGGVANNMYRSFYHESRIHGKLSRLPSSIHRILHG